MSTVQKQARFSLFTASTPLVSFLISPRGPSPVRTLRKSPRRTVPVPVPVSGNNSNDNDGVVSKRELITAAGYEMHISDVQEDETSRAVLTKCARMAEGRNGTGHKLVLVDNNNREDKGLYGAQQQQGGRLKFFKGRPRVVYN